MSAGIVKANLFRHLWLSSICRCHLLLFRYEISLKEIEFNLIDEIPLINIYPIITAISCFNDYSELPQAKPFKESKNVTEFNEVEIPVLSSVRLRMLTDVL